MIQFRPGVVSYSPFDAWIDGNETGPATAIPAPTS